MVKGDCIKGEHFLKELGIEISEESDYQDISIIVKVGMKYPQSRLLSIKYIQQDHEELFEKKFQQIMFNQEITKKCSFPYNIDIIWKENLNNNLFEFKKYSFTSFIGNISKEAFKLIKHSKLILLIIKIGENIKYFVIIVVQ